MARPSAIAPWPSPDADRLSLEIARLTAALNFLRVDPYQRRELEGALHALSWATGQHHCEPIDWQLPRATVELVDRAERELRALLTGQPEGDDPATLAGVSKPGSLDGEIPASFIERSQPREGV